MNTEIKMSQEEMVEASIGSKKIHMTGHVTYFVSLISVVALFLYYQEQHAQREQESLDRIERGHAAVDQQRIDRCHSVQEAGTAALERNSHATLELAKAMNDWDETLLRIEQTGEETVTALQEILIHTRRNQER